MADRASDKYANVLNGVITTAGATATNTELITGIDLGRGRGVIIDQIDYTIDETVVADYVAGASGDRYVVNWAVQSEEFGIDNSRVIHQWELTKWEDGAPASAGYFSQPNVFQFFPALIFASPRIFLNGIGTAAISGGNIRSRMYFRYVDLKAQEYLELAESFVLIS